MTKTDEKHQGGGGTPRDRLEELLLLRGWSEKQLSERAGLGHGYVNSALKKENWRPQQEKLAALSVALDCDPEYLLGDSNKVRSNDAIRPGAIWRQASQPPAAVAFLDFIDDKIEKCDECKVYQIARGFAGSVGMVAGSSVIVSTSEPCATGDLVLAHGAGGDLEVFYYAEPYLVSVDATGRMRHEIRNETTLFVGKIILSINVPDLKIN
ncbi:helix-turn-helix domain-containing protein [Roseobacter litoralis]|uniref:helix-turn-helix domain-containing protein n=1 Tax=Roseobacter litoralis TaxID=42443 RepID=UPI002493F1CE|nr:helix-turn-helix transcriptional regulator [Roseobacter litoralis]